MDKIKKHLPIIIAIVYFIICTTICFSRIAFWDEARAWLIAQNCNLSEFLDMMKLEFHFFIWFLIIAPFAKLNFLYPYSIYLLNTFFATSAIYILWKKAPFNYVQKSLITFSVPFLFLWGNTARCYSIGILFLFLALSIYTIRNKKPYRYLTYLCLCAHTSVMAFIGSFFLLILFLFENIKNKNFLKYLGIFILSNILILFQIYDPNADFFKQAPEMMFLRDFIFFLISPIIFIKGYEFQSILMSLLRCSVIVTTFIFIKYSFKNNKKALFFIVSTYFSMIVLFSLFYSGNYWHYFYFYLYFIVAIWLISLKNNLPKALSILFYIILILFMFKGSIFIDGKLNTINNSKSKIIAQEIEEKFQDKKIFCLDPWSDIVPATLAYLDKKIIIYDKHNLNRRNPKSLRNQIDFNINFFNPDEFSKYIDDNSILVTTGVFLKHEENNPIAKFYNDKIIFKGNSVAIVFEKIYENQELNFYVYKITNKLD